MPKNELQLSRAGCDSCNVNCIFFFSPTWSIFYSLLIFLLKAWRSLNICILKPFYYEIITDSQETAKWYMYVESVCLPPAFPSDDILYNHSRTQDPFLSSILKNISVVRKKLLCLFLFSFLRLNWIRGRGQESSALLSVNTLGRWSSWVVWLWPLGEEHGYMVSWDWFYLPLWIGLESNFKRGASKGGMGI